MKFFSTTCSVPKSLLIAFIGFNIWHATNRGIWIPMSIVNSLHLSESTAKVFQQWDPNITASTYADDSQQIFIITHDPLLRNKTFISLMDFPQYRYQRILYPWVCCILSLGHMESIPYILFFINLLAFVGGGFISWKIVNMNHWSKLLVVAYFANTGLLYASFNDMTETLALFFVLLGLFYWLKLRENIALICFSLAVLTRETFITVPLSILVWDYLTQKKSLMQVIRLIGAMSAPFIIWCLYIQYQLPGGTIASIPAWSPPSLGIGRFSVPFVAMWQEAYFGFHHLTTHTELKRTLSLTIVTTLLAIILVHGYLRRRNLWSWIAMTQGIFITMLRGDIWNFHLGAARIAIPLFILFSAWCADEMQFESSRSIS